MAAAFSRMQLAAALIEYDNDLDNPEAPNRSAQESAIFAPMRRNGPSRYQLGSRARKSDYLGVSLPSEGGTVAGAQRESVVSRRKSRASTIGLNNPFGRDETVDGFEEEEDNLEVDLASWGLDAFIPKEKGSKTSRNTSIPREVPNTQTGPSRLRTSPVDRNTAPQRRRTTRSMSVGNMDQYRGTGDFLDAEPSYVHNPHRRRSFGSPLDLVGMEAPEFISRRTSSYPAIDQITPRTPLHSVPFPTSSARSDSPIQADDEKSALAYRRLSTTSTKLLDEALDFDNPFAVQAPSPNRASRFDPKAERVRATSNTTMATQGLLGEDGEEQQLADGTRMRTLSNGSVGSRFLLGDDRESVNETEDHANERPYSTMELMRPKILVMPSPLQPIKPKATEAPPVSAREGFELSTDGTPLPQGARPIRRLSTAISLPIGSNLLAPVASNSFTPNPRSTLSLSQLTFRNTLLVGGQRDVAYSDLDNALPRATEDGEQIGLPSPELPVSELPPPKTESETDFIDVGPVKVGRPAGKLYGKSLIDDLENRKALMRSKQRRRKAVHDGTRPGAACKYLIDPATLQSRPISQHLDSFGSANSRPGLSRKNSLNVKPLLNFDEELPSAAPGLGARLASSRSVFGVDTLWEREMAKLKDIEAHEKLEADAREKQEALEESKRRKGKGKGKRKGRNGKGELQSQPTPEMPEVPVPRVSADPPILPAIQKPTLKGLPPAANDTDSASDRSEALGPHARQTTDTAAERWVGGSSDEEDTGPRRTTGSGPRFRSNVQIQRVVDDDSEEDLPLSAAVNRTMMRNTGLRPPSADSDEERKPLSVLIENRKSALPSLNSKKGLTTADDDEDEMPLGLRVSRNFPSGHAYNGSNRSATGDRDEDNTPLALHPEQRRRTQYQMMAQQQQQQQQQMMMQAQFQNSMFFGPPAPMMVTPPYFAAPMTMMPPVPMVMSPPPPAQDAGKFGRVDRWRHDVAVEGEE